MNRYFYYLTLVTMIVNMVGSVPKILFKTKDFGTITSILIAIAIGILFIYWITSFFNQFPGVGFPELLKNHMPKWISTFLLFCFGLMWFFVGLETFISNTFLMKRFLTTQTPIFWIAVLLLFFVSFGVLLSTKSVLYTVEIILLLNLPLFVLVIVELYANENLKWDFIRKAWMYLYHQPNYSSFSAAIFVFLGLFNLSIFNREFNNKQHHTPLQLLLFCVLGAGLLLTTYFIPIGYNGFDNINFITYPWILTADSIKVGFAFIERVMFVFLIVYQSIAFLGLIISWHVGLEFLKSLGSIRQLNRGGYDLTPYLFLLLFWIISLWTSVHFSEYHIMLYAGYLFKMMPPFCFIFLFVCWYIHRRVKTS
ncbi:GerAB/ArcD/ProY family transporter [Bacillus sp. EB600]|uniref:GerAB/ArcD/ProY family transporter n=1 Tax=Bacillus sp. EB600 TaxID=2806345 RepID=UPI00210CD61B|nr:GerAB/ArcD/ProY family transporter [Bacillus sp. EB600]MCQ6282478.1 GerAB/ArcD/ProY family transporter [Bacillus sp. EB600]